MIADVQSWRYVTAVFFSLGFASCEDRRADSVWWQMEQEKVALTQRLVLLKYRFESTESGRVEEFARITGNLQQLAKSKEMLQLKRASLLDEIGDMEKMSINTDGGGIRQRRAGATGRKYDSFAVKDGRIFENVTIVKVGDSGVVIRHESGAATLRYSDLTPEQSEMFGLEEGSALAAEKREQEAAVAYDRSIDQGMIALEKQKERAAASATVEEEKAARLRAAILAKEEADYRARPLAKPASPVGPSWSRGWCGDSGYRYYRPVRRSVYYYPSYPYSSVPYSSGTSCQSADWSQSTKIPAQKIVPPPSNTTSP